MQRINLSYFYFLGVALGELKRMEFDPPASTSDRGPSGAVPLPLWWPAVTLGVKVLHKTGFDVVKPDQLTRAVSEKTTTAKECEYELRRSAFSG